VLVLCRYGESSERPWYKGCLVQRLLRLSSPSQLQSFHMPVHSSLKLLAVLSSLPFTLASYTYGAFTAGIVYSGQGWVTECYPGAATCWDQCADNVAYGQSPTPQYFEYTFAVPSTTWEWWGFEDSSYGTAQVCWDGATTGCDTVNFSNPSSSIGSDAPVLLYSKTGLSDAIHTATVTNVPSSAGQTGPLNVDHMVIDGGLPYFPPGASVGTLLLEPEAMYALHLEFGDLTKPPVYRKSWIRTALGHN
jgi:hypothetical protein